MKSKKTKDKKAHVHPELEGFELQINSFGEMSSNFTVERINDFLNKKVDDRKMQEGGLQDTEKHKEDQSSEEIKSPAPPKSSSKPDKNS